MPLQYRNMTHTALVSFNTVNFHYSFIFCLSHGILFFSVTMSTMLLNAASSLHQFIIWSDVLQELSLFHNNMLVLTGNQNKCNYVRIEMEIANVQ